MLLCTAAQDATELLGGDSDRLRLLDSRWKLRLRRADIADTGRYSCKATNVAGSAEKYFDLNVLGAWLNHVYSANPPFQ